MRPEDLRSFEWWASAEPTEPLEEWPGGFICCRSTLRSFLDEHGYGELFRAKIGHLPERPTVEDCLAQLALIKEFLLDQFDLCPPKSMSVETRTARQQIESNKSWKVACDTKIRQYRRSPDRMAVWLRQSFRRKLQGAEMICWDTLAAELLSDS